MDHNHYYSHLWDDANCAPQALQSHILYALSIQQDVALARGQGYTKYRSAGERGETIGHKHLHRAGTVLLEAARAGKYPQRPSTITGAIKMWHAFLPSTVSAVKDGHTSLLQQASTYLVRLIETVQQPHDSALSATATPHDGTAGPCKITVAVSAATTVSTAAQARAAAPPCNIQWWAHHHATSVCGLTTMQHPVVGWMLPQGQRHISGAVAHSHKYGHGCKLVSATQQVCSEHTLALSRPWRCVHGA
eukprot:1158892-Pelagomonas_calceolata.AAC.9